MNNKSAACGVLLALLSAAAAPTLQAQVSVTTYHNDLSRTGADTQESILTPANVNSTTFGKLFAVPVDGALYAQPLYLPNVTIAGGTHNVLYVATEHDSVYAVDADNGSVYAQVSLIPSGGSTVNSSTDLGCGDLVPEIGITGTPVIDPSTGTLYVVAKSKVSGSFVQYLHALDVTTLAEKLGGPTLIQAGVPGSGYDASNGQVVFSPKMQNQRAALALTNGHVLISWSSHCDADPWHGWLMSYGAASLSLEAVFNSSPNSSRSGIWMSGAAPAVDASGNIYLATGNGGFDPGSDYGDSIVKLGAPTNGAFAVLDYFTPYDQSTLNADDIDLASGGIVLLPPLASGHQFLAQQGKAGTIVLLDTGNLGKYCGSLSPACSGADPQIVQEIQGASSGIWGSPAYWNGNLYWTGANDTIQAYSFNAGGSGLISTTPTSHSSQIFAFSAPTPVISANGATNGILWALDGSADDSTCDGGGSACLGLFAYDATNLANLLYTSAQAANNRDSPGVAVKFEKPIVANGKVYVGTQGAVTAYGLLSGALPFAATPNISPPSGSYTNSISVSLADTTPGAVIHYTTNGTTPTVSSAVYGTPISLSSSATVQAIAVASGYSTSAVASATYVVHLPTEVSLAGSANVSGIASAGVTPANGGFDADGYAYAANLLGSSITWNGATYAIGAGGTNDAVTGVTVPLPAGNYASISLLGAAVNGAQTNQSFVVHYADGTSATVTQSLSDWAYPHNYAGEAQALSMPYRIGPGGVVQNLPIYLYGYTFAVDSTKSVSSITLPANRNAVFVAIDAGTSTVNLTSASGLNLVKGATESGGVLGLSASGSGGSARAVWSDVPFDVRAFTTSFTFRITPAAANIADGFTFTVQNSGPAAVGGAGGSLGYQGLGSSVAVKFDLYNNAGEGVDSTGIFTNGAAPTVPAVNLASSGINLHSGDLMQAQVTYDGTTLRLTLTDTVTHATFQTSQALNIPSIVGGNKAYVGFTAGTGGLTATQQILSWSFSSGFPAVSDATGFATAGGLTLVGGAQLSNGALQLSDGAGNEARAAWSAGPVNVTAFATDFDFQEGAANADGFTFCIQNAGPSAIGQTGGALGYAGIGSSVAIKFDLYNNAGEGTDSTGFYTNGAYPSVPALDLTASAINLHSPDVTHVHITYDGANLSLSITDAITGATYSASQPLNIPSIVGGNTAYVGFTAGTGGLSAVQQILDWSYVAY
jgi:hypothetical protein